MTTLPIVFAALVTAKSFTPDPAPVADGETLWVFTGHDMPKSNWFNMPDWQVLSTKNMVDWTHHGVVMGTDVFKWAHQGDRAWASQAVKRNGRWYWYVAVMKEGGGDCIGVATAASPLGPWRAPIGKPLAGPGQAWIDPTVFVDGDGSAWLFWGNCGGTPACWYAELGRDMVSLKSEIKPVPGLMDEKAFGPTLKRKDGTPRTNFEEAPWVYKRGNTYYLEYAAGGIPERWAYSTAKSIHGPWTYGGEILSPPERSFTIHGGSVEFKGRNYLFYHNGMAPGGGGFCRSACFKEFKYNPDGSIPRLEFDDIEAKACETAGENGGLGIMVRRNRGEWKHATRRVRGLAKAGVGDGPEDNAKEPLLYHAEDGTWHLFWKARGKDWHAASRGPDTLGDWGRQRPVGAGEERAMLEKARAAGGTWTLTDKQFRSVCKPERLTSAP